MADFELLAPGGHQELVDEVLDRLDTKADYDGYYAQLTAGAADNLTGRGDGVSASYLYRTTGGDADVADGTATVKSIHGRTLVWNQMVQLADQTTTSNGVTFVCSTNGAVTVNGTATDNAYVTLSRDFVQGHKYLIKGCPANGSASTYRSYVTGGNPTIFSALTDTGSGAIGTALSTGSTYYVLAYVSSGTTVTNLVFRPQLFDLTAMFGEGNEPSTVAEFEALYPLPYYEYDAGSLLSVQMDGIETVGFNQWDEEWEVGGISSTTGENAVTNNSIRSKNYIHVFPGQTYYYRVGGSFTSGAIKPRYYDAEKNYIGYIDSNGNQNGANVAAGRVMPSNCHYLRFEMDTPYGTTYNHDICVNLSWSGYRNGEYEPYWKSERTIPAATYFPNGMRSAGTVYDELTADEAIVRVGEVDLGTLTWGYSSSTGRFYTNGISGTVVPSISGQPGNIMCVAYDNVRDADTINHERDKIMSLSTGGIVSVYDTSYGTDTAAFKAAMSGITLYYALATPVTTPIDPPLNLSYRVSDFGTERVMVPVNEQSAPPTMQVVYGLNVVDTVRRLPTEYISHDSFTQFRIALATFLGATITESWDATDNRYEYTITQNGE